MNNVVIEKKTRFERKVDRGFKTLELLVASKNKNYEQKLAELHKKQKAFGELALKKLKCKKFEEAAKAYMVKALAIRMEFNLVQETEPKKVAYLGLTRLGESIAWGEYEEAILKAYEKNPDSVKLREEAAQIFKSRRGEVRFAHATT